MKNHMYRTLTTCALMICCATARGEGRAKEAFLGVATEPVTDVLASQLKLGRGMGLVISHVVEGSPAQGVLEESDILLMLGDQRLVNQDQLVTLIRSEAPGAEVQLTILRGGERVEKKVTLGEREAREEWGEEWPKIHISGPNVKWFGATNLLDFSEHWDQEAFDEMMQKLQTESRDRWMKIGEDSKAEIMRSISNVLKGVQSSFSSSVSVAGPSVAASSVTTLLEDGLVITITGSGDSRHLTIKKQDGEVVFDGPIDTEEQRALIPEEYRKKLDEIEGMEDDIKVDVED